jgi:signal transduction histidine kinase
VTRRPGLSLKLGAALSLAVVASLLVWDALTLGESRAAALVFCALAAVSALVFAALLDVLVTRPLLSLARQVRRMEEVGLREPFVPSGTDEPRELGEALERLRVRVLDQQSRLEVLNAELEARVQARSSQLAAAQRELGRAEKLASVGQLAGGVAHEVNNPAGVILARAMFLLEGDLPPGLAEDLRVIARQAERVRDITGSLLRFARQGAGEREAVDLADVAGTAATLVRIEARRRGITVVEELAPLVVLADPRAMEQVAFNLLQNAVYAARSAVRITTTRGCLEVRDDGAGVRPDDVPHLFEPFFTTKPVGEGTGLGLAVVHGIVSAHGGSITYRPGEGACFVVTLPPCP